MLNKLCNDKMCHEVHVFTCLPTTLVLISSLLMDTLTGLDNVVPNDKMINEQ
jgi:hypothetical protein